MAVFSAKNERFFLYCMWAVFFLYAAYYATAYYIYLNSEELSEQFLQKFEQKDLIFTTSMVVLSGFYFYSFSEKRKATFDFLLFYYIIFPVTMPYFAFRHKGFLKGAALIIFWITTYMVPYWTWYLLYTWTYWGYESP